MKDVTVSVSPAHKWLADAGTGGGGGERPVDADEHSAEDEDHVDQGQADDQLVECLFEIFLTENHHADQIPCSKQSNFTKVLQPLLKW